MSDISGVRKAWVSVMSLSVAVLLGACGSSSSTGGATVEPPAERSAVAGESGTEASDATIVPVSGFEFGYTVTTPTAAGTYTFDFVNTGNMDHELVLEGGTDAATDIVGPGETDSFTVTLEPGDYTLYCSIGNHRAQGMEVSFSVS